MSRLTVHPARDGLTGSVPVFADARIAAHAAVLAAVARGTSEIRGRDLGPRLDEIAGALSSLGVAVTPGGAGVSIHGRGLAGLEPPDGPIRAGDALAFHLLAGLLAAQCFASELVGPRLDDTSSRALVAALGARGVRIEIAHDAAGTILRIAERPRGQRLEAWEYSVGPRAAALKAALLLSGLGASGPTAVGELVATADHCERQLEALGVPIEGHGTAVCLHPPRSADALAPFSFDVPGDVDAAAYLCAAAAVVPDSRVDVRDVGLNPSRCGGLEALRLFGADVRVEPHGAGLGEPSGRVQCASATGALRGLVLGGEPLDRLDDVGPVLIVAACARGGTVIEASLRPALVRALGQLGVQVETLASGVRVEATLPLRGATISARDDASVALCGAVLGLVADGPTTVLDADCLSVFPRFAGTLRALGAQVEITS